MSNILETQKRHIGLTVAKYPKLAEQFSLFDFMKEDLRQLEADKRYWDKRLTMIEEELKFEPDRIREIYEVKAKRIEPVGLVYLWPVTG